MAGAIDRSGGARTSRKCNFTEKPNMKISKYFSLVVVTLLPPLTGFSQTANPPTASQPSARSNLSPDASDVAKLAQSGVGDDVIRAFIAQSQSYYNLSAADIAALKAAGVSSQAVTKMLDHDGALRAQQASASLPASTPSSAQVATRPSDTTTSSTAAANPPSAHTTVVVQSATPPPQVEVVPVSPGPDYLWTPGSWSWNGGAWIWIGGHWHYPVRPGHVWIGGYWGGHGRGRAWVGGHWR